MSILTVGDLHIRKEEPFLKAYGKFFEWIVEQEFNNPANTLVQVGDWFHFDKPSPLVYELVYRFLKEFKFQEVFVLGGNHDYRREDSSYAFFPFKDFPNIRYITVPEVHVIEDHTCMFLPFVYMTAKNKIEGSFYETAITTLQTQIGKPIDYTFHHLATEKQSFQNKYDIESKELLGRHIGGHIHIELPPDYIGVPFPTRADEAGQRGKLIQINSDKSEIEIPVPLFLDYTSVMFGEDPEINKEGVTLLNVIDAPSKSEAKRRYQDYYINRTELLLTTLSDTGEETEINQNKTNKELFADFAKEKKLNPEVIKKIESVL